MHRVQKLCGARGEGAKRVNEEGREDEEKRECVYENVWCS
jgi:hypothetical protein